MGYESSFSGTIDEFPAISIDNFKDFEKTAYFLSHAHTDHTAPLISSHQSLNGNQEFADYLAQQEVFIYMSDVTAKIFEYEFSDLANFVKPLKMGDRQLISLPASEKYKETHFYVTLIPAGHCLGSAMLLFETNRKTVLFTGDFRYSQNDVSKIRDLHSKTDHREPISIDTMYLDTTFLDANKEDFPKRTECIDYLLREVTDWLAKGDEYKVMLSTPAKYGYEYIFNEIYKRIGIKVLVNDRKWTLYSKMSDVLPGVTNDKNEVAIHTCMFNGHRHCNMPKDKYKFLIVHISAMKWNNYDLEDVPIKKYDSRIDLCFSSHSSRSELIYFVNYFAPKKVVGFPQEYKVNTTPKKRDLVKLSPIGKRRRFKV